MAGDSNVSEQGRSIVAIRYTLKIHKSSYPKAIKRGEIGPVSATIRQWS